MIHMLVVMVNLFGCSNIGCKILNQQLNFQACGVAYILTEGSQTSKVAQINTNLEPMTTQMNEMAHFGMQI